MVAVEAIREPCRIIGVLDDGGASLSAEALGHLRQADLVVGAGRLLQQLQPELSATCETRDLVGALSQVPEWVRQALDARRKVVVLATGDPLCHGIAPYLISRLCFDACEILPNLSTLQLACARVGLPWHDLKITSVHHQDAGEWQADAGHTHGLAPLLRDLHRHDRLAILTSPANTPDRIARLLVQENLAEEFRMAVAERLRTPDERLVLPESIAAAATQTFAEPNVVLLWRNRLRTMPVLFGREDTAFQPRQPDKGLITKREVRAVSLARLQLKSDSLVWDIGAGSGSVGLEAARLCPHGHVYAIEKNAADADIARANRLRLGVYNYSLRCARAPDGLEHWPDPDAVFIGGSGGELAQLISLSLQRLRPGGWLVMNFVTVENLTRALETLQQQQATWDLTQMQIARSKPILDMHRLAAENPVWILSAQAGQTSAPSTREHPAP